EARLDISCQGEVDEVIPLADVLAQDARGWMGATLRDAHTPHGGHGAYKTPGINLSISDLYVPQAGAFDLGAQTHIRIHLSSQMSRLMPFQEVRPDISCQGEVDEAVHLHYTELSLTNWTTVPVCLTHEPLGSITGQCDEALILTIWRCHPEFSGSAQLAIVLTSVISFRVLSVLMVVLLAESCVPPFVLSCVTGVGVFGLELLCLVA
ncbi:hypothetical protein HGM15179_020137, partial [Zosterops borbonicus]